MDQTHLSIFQKEILVEFLTNHKQMIRGKFSASYTRNDYRRDWADLADILNSDENGCWKEVDQWRGVSFINIYSS